MAAKHQGLREEAARWFTRMQNAAPDDPVRGKFETWLLSDPAHAAEYHAFSDIWQDFEHTDKLQSLASAMERRQGTESLTVKSQKLQKIVRQSVLSLLLVISGFIAFHLWQAQPLMQVALNTGVGEIKRQRLADGSELVLNANTEAEIIYYRHQRMVKLRRGEVIFSVSKDAARPFVVDSGYAKVTVLGTYFAVDRLRDLVRVSVDHGSVRVEASQQQANGATLVLHDGEVAEVHQGEAPMRVHRKAASAFGFRQGTVVFEEATLTEIAETLSRYRRIPLRTHVSSQSGLRVTAVVQIADIEGFLQVLPHIAAVQLVDTNGETQIIAR